LGGFLKLMDFILWTSSSFNIADSSPPLPFGSGRTLMRATSLATLTSSNLATPQQWLTSNNSLQAIFEALLRMCTSPGADALLVNPNRPVASQSGTRIVGIHESILSLFSDIFNLEIRQTKSNTLARTNLKYAKMHSLLSSQIKLN